MRLISHPVLCNYYITYRCNASCSFCDIWERPSGYADIEHLKSNLHDLKKLGVKVIDFTGGEPLLHRQIDLMLMEAKRLGFITTLTTNGLLYPKWSEKIKGLVDMLHFSLDYFDEEKHNESRGVDCYHHVMESLQIAGSLGERPDILFTVFEENVTEIEDVYNEICVPNKLMLLLNPVFDYNEVTTGPLLTESTLQLITKWGKRPNVYLNDAFITLRRDGGNHINDPVCKAASSTIVIGPNNELILPCYHLEKGTFQIENNLLDLYESKEVQEIVKMEGRYRECEGCVINCYMQPSFAVEINKYWMKAIGSTLKYNWEKGTWKELIGL